jgi:plasmid stabilization system protein ParE
MNFPLVFHRDVQGEVDEAYRWYEQQRTGLGDDFLAAVDAVLHRLQTMPQVHAPIYAEVRRTLLTRFPYAAFYRIHSDRVEVIAVQHTRRDPHSWQVRV